MLIPLSFNFVEELKCAPIVSEDAVTKAGIRKAMLSSLNFSSARQTRIGLFRADFNWMYAKGSVQVQYLER
jgi:hypothetical protein